MTFCSHSKSRKHVISLVLIFFIIYDISFSFLPYLTSGRIAVLFLLITNFNTTSLDKIFYWGFATFGLALFYALFQSIYSCDLTQVSRLFWFIIYGWILPCVVSFYLEKAEYLYRLLFFAVTLQAIIVFVMFFNIEFRFHILDILEVDSNINPYENFQRSFGFTSLTGSAFSIVQAGGFFSGIYYLTISKFNSILIKLLIFLGLMVILLSTVLIGRTGLFISIFLLLFYIVFISNITQKIIILLLLFYFFQLDIESSFIFITENVEGFKSEWFITWIEEAFSTRNNSTLTEINNMNVPPISLETIVGMGLVKSENGFGNASMNDSGYIQTYYSLGLIISVVFYLTYFCLSFFRWLKSKRNPLVLIFLIIVFLVEYKEPFIFKYSLPFLLTTFLIYENKLQES